MTRRLTPTLTPQAFVAKWKRSALKESAGDREHFIDLCHLVGHETPAEADATGASFAFQYGATKLGGGQGFADVFKRGFFGWEYKGKGANLEKAYQQLLQYRESLHNPPLLVVSDLATIIVHPNFINRANRPTTITLDDLLTPAGLTALRAIFLNPAYFESAETPESVTQRMAGEFAQLADRLRQRGYVPPQVAHFLIRLLFCLFAEDVALLPEGLFGRLVARTRREPAAFSAQLRHLFGTMSTGGWFGADQIPHFNGGLFDDDAVLILDDEAMEVLARIVPADWSVIEPSIFGTLFERGLDPGKRSQLGAHYTSKEDILLVVEPVLMAPLRRRWDAVQAQARHLAAQRRVAKGQKQANLARQMQNVLLDFSLELAAVKVLDPACGSGNFLYLALLSLLDLWKTAYNEMLALQLTGLQPMPGLAPSPGQLYGIEINEYAHELAQATIWIGYIQWLRANGFGSPPEPILQPLQTIRRMDAIMQGVGTGDQGLGDGVREPEWPAVDVIVGNPPFLGDKKMRAELGDAYVEALRDLYAGRVSGGADLVTYWFEKARAQIEAGKARRAGLLATNSIRMGENRRVLERIKAAGDVFMAWDDRAWILDGASVRVSIVGFDNGSESERQLNGQAVPHINADLTSSVDVTRALSLRENQGICFLGMMKAGPFDIDGDTAQHMLAEPMNPNGQPNSDVVRRRLGGQDVVGRPRDTWIIDFAEMAEQEAALYQEPFEHVRTVVKPLRDKSRDDRMRQYWWLHGRSRPALRAAIRGFERIIVTPEVSKHRIFAWMQTSVVPDHKLHVFAREDDYFFGVLHSTAHETWSLATCSWMGVGNDPSYSSSRTFETFPFPWPPGQEPADDPRVEAIAAAARELVQLRDAWLNPPGAAEAELKKRTLTNLYNQRPTWLDNAHRRLDAAVCAVYGWPADLTDEEILERLLALNLARAAQALPAGRSDEQNTH